MPWVNLFEHEATQVFLTTSGNDVGYVPLTGIPMAHTSATPIDVALDCVDGPPGAEYVPETGTFATVRLDPATCAYQTVVVPSGGIGERRFRARVLNAAWPSGDDDGWPSTLYLYPGYLVIWCGLMWTGDEMASVTLEQNAPPIDSDWHEFEITAASPVDSVSGWQGLVMSQVVRGDGPPIYGIANVEWQVWVDPSPTDTALVTVTVAPPPTDTAVVTVTVDPPDPQPTDTALVTITVEAPPPAECPCDTPYVPTPPPLPSAQACFDETEKWRVRLTGYHVLHDQTNTDSQCLSVRVDRVVNCMKECGIEEFVYCWPQGCPITVLPPGVYDIYVPAQSAYPLEPGTEVEVMVLLEPVGDDYVAALNISSRGGSPCCDC